MSGYKRVNFYELCRLCASNQQKEKTHIFQEEGRKIQLQTKIQSCLSLTVCENDFLPKVVCSQCLSSLEECYVFRKECVSSESMLSSYFKNFRYTEDFKRSGKVYIKDTSAKMNSAVTQTVNEAVTSFVADKNVVQQQQQHADLKSKTQQQQQQQQQPFTYSINPLNLAATAGNIKNVISKHVVSEALGNLALNANNEIINIAQLVDLESLVCQQPQYVQKKHNKQHKKPQQNDAGSVIKVQMAPPPPPLQPAQNNLIDGGDFDLNPPLKLLPHIKNSNSNSNNNNNNNKFTAYSIKIDDMKNANNNVVNHQTQTVLINPALDQNQMLYTTSTTTTSSSTAQQTHTTTINNPIIHSTNNFQQIIETNTCNNNYNIITTKPYSVDDQMQVNNNSNSNSNNKNHTCDICRKTFKRREHLYQHIKLHTGFRPFTCDSCNKSFMRKEHLLRHMTSHSGQKNFTCTICEKSFSRNDNLLKHRKTHDKQTSFTCDVCQKQFVMRHYYVAHKLTHEKSTITTTATSANVVDKCATINGNSWGLLKV